MTDEEHTPAPEPTPTQPPPPATQPPPPAADGAVIRSVSTGIDSERMLEPDEPETPLEVATGGKSHGDGPITADQINRALQLLGIIATELGSIKACMVAFTIGTEQMEARRAIMSAVAHVRSNSKPKAKPSKPKPAAKKRARR